MPSFLEVCTNRTIFGDSLVDPVRTHAKKVEELFDPVDSISEVALRIIKALGLLIALPATALLYLIAGMGLIIKYVWVYGILSNDLSRLSQKLESVYVSPKEALLDLKNQAVDFANTYRPTLLSPGFSQQRDSFNEIVSTLKELLKIPPRFFYKAPLEDGKLEVPMDGNCLLHATIGGLELDISHEELRAECVKWMRENLETDSTLQTYIGLAITDYKADLKNRLTEEKTSYEFEDNKIELSKTIKKIEEIDARVISPEDYLKLAQRVGFYGSRAEIHAISQLYHVAVEIERKGFETEKMGEGENVLKLIHVNNNHFDTRLVSCFSN